MRLRRYRRGHPWVFMLAFGTLLAALVNGDLVVAAAMAAVVWWTMHA